MDVKAKRLRREGYVTGNVFGREIEGSIPVKMLKTEVDKLLKTAHKTPGCHNDKNAKIINSRLC